MNKKIFICHSGTDKKVVRRLCHDLLRDGLDIWFDEWEIRAGDSIPSKIREGLFEADYVIVAVSNAMLSSPWATREFNSSLTRSLSGAKVSLLLARLENCEMPADMADIVYADFSQSYEQGINQLREAIFDAPVIREDTALVEIKGTVGIQISPPSLYSQINYLYKLGYDCPKNISVRFKAGETLEALFSAIEGRVANFESEPEEWRRPELDLCGSLCRELEIARGRVSSFQKLFALLIEEMLKYPTYTPEDILISSSYYASNTLLTIMASLAYVQSPKKALVAGPYPSNSDDEYYTLVYGLSRKHMQKVVAGLVFQSVAGIPIISDKQFSFYWPSRGLIEAEKDTWAVPLPGTDFFTEDWCKYALPQLFAKYALRIDPRLFVNKNELFISIKRI